MLRIPQMIINQNFPDLFYWSVIESDDFRQLLFLKNPGSKIECEGR